MTVPGPPPDAQPQAAEPLPVDAVVIGAGPVGLFQVFELGLLEVRCHVIDALAEPGGQCISLYADKPIYDIPGTLKCTGRELIERLLRQAAPFSPEFHLSQIVDRVQVQPDGRFLVETTARTRLLSKSVVIAGGVGSFQPRRLNVQGLEPHEGLQVFHSIQEPEQFAGMHLMVVGDGQAAVEQALLHTQPGGRRAARVTLMHRRDDFKADARTMQALRDSVASGRVQLLIAQITEIHHDRARLQAITTTGSDGTVQRVPLDAMVVLLGLSPKLGPIAEWGLAMERKQLVVDSERFETSVPGIHAVGDVNSYPGKQKLILCGFHEATLAAFGIAHRVFPSRPVRLEYTTTSTRLQRALQVSP